MVREFTLISIGGHSAVPRQDVPARVLEVMDELRGRYAESTGEIRAQFEEAHRRGETTIDVEVPADETAAAITERVTELLDEADEFCRTGRTLTLASEPEVVAWRHWWRDQVVGQIRKGAEPRAFTRV